MRILRALRSAAVLVWAAGCGNAAPPAATSQPASSTAAFRAVSSEIGGVDETGPYDVVANWPKPLSQLPGHDKWTWGSTEAVYAESPDRVLVVQLGELPALERPATRPLPDIG